MKPVSVIVPVYNAEKTIAGCLGNLVHQTLQDIEIIVINDASTDGSLSILQACATQFPDKVIVIDSPENRGPGGARNLGLDTATGEYIGFADADDLCDTGMYEKLYAAAKAGDYDMVDGGYLDEKNDRAILLTGDDCTGVLNGEKRSKLIVEGGFLWSRIFRRSLFETPEKLRMREHITALEDAEIMTYLFATAFSVGSVKEILYRYRNTEDSASSIIDPPGYYACIREAMQAVYDRTYELGNYEEIRNAVEYEILQMYSWGINACLKAVQDKVFSRAEANERLRTLRSLKNGLVKSQNYKSNPYVREKIPKADLKNMMDADKLP